MKKYVTPYRLAAYLALFFAVAHTAGGMAGDHAGPPEAAAVLRAMKTVTFPVMGATVSWYGEWLGFGLMVTIYLLLAAVLFWQLGGLLPAERRRLLAVEWALFAAFVGTAALSFAYFFAPPAITATLIAILAGVECVRDSRAA